MATQPSKSKFPNTPEGLASRWAVEFEAAEKKLKKWHEKGAIVVKRFLDEREDERSGDTRVNLFWSNVTTLRAMLYGRPPASTVTRRFADADDDVARVAGEMLERILDADADGDGEGYCQALQQALEDRLLPGLGQARVRYEAELEEVPGVPARLGDDGVEMAPAVPPSEGKVSEEVEVDYVHWRDFLWSPARTWGAVRWVAFASHLSREELVERFGDAGKLVPLSSPRKRSEDADEDAQAADPWARACVWEVWDKEMKQVLWWVRGHSRILEVRADPLGLEGFFPCPRPMVANATTTAFLPRPDYALMQDQYNEVDTLSTRITLLERAIRVAGVYDKSAGELKALLSDTKQNQLIPVDTWAMFAEKGGLRGVIDWLPLEQVTAALGALHQERREVMDLVFQVSGMADIMRGQASAAGTSATEQAIKARFGSVRVQSMQDEFARFASDIQRLRAEVVSKHFDEASIITQSNVGKTPDADFAAQAAAFIKSPEALFRVEVKPESVSLEDFSALKSERMELLAGLSAFLQSAAPLVSQMPQALPHLLRMLQWTMAGFRGASEIEGVLDRAISAAQQAPPPGQQGAQAPDPKLLTQQLKGQQDLAKVQAELEADLVRTNAEVEADARREQNQAVWNTREAAAKQQLSAANRNAFTPTVPR